jgi:hypothetical protein
MAWWVHPCPRLSIGEIVVEFNSQSQAVECLIMSALVISYFPIKKSGTHC